ncbi:MAG TPA: helix-turn-helix transcriptional regulator [Pilimelia sp.]|nr:helix-turn-helix transcriptional regulator [Pilimelia sp.]
MANAGALVIGGPIPSLVRWGCSPDADLVYRELVNGGPRSAATLARQLGLSWGRVRDGLQELHDVDAAVPYREEGSTRADHWRPRPLHHVLAALGERRRRPVGAAAPARQQLYLVSSLLGTNLEPDATMRHLPSVAATRQRLAELASVERHEQLAINTERAFDATAVRAGAQLDRALLARGVNVRVMGLQPATIRPAYTVGGEPAHPRWEYRESSTVPLKLFVIDRKVALFPVDPANRERGYLEVARSSVVEALAALFDRHWAQARDPRENDMPQLNLTARERSLIHLLAMGHTDATAARELQISPRSVSNILRALMDQLGVENRFQLGLALGTLRLAEMPVKQRTTDSEES